MNRAPPEPTPRDVFGSCFTGKAGSSPDVGGRGLTQPAPPAPPVFPGTRQRCGRSHSAPPGCWHQAREAAGLAVRVWTYGHRRASFAGHEDPGFSCRGFWPLPSKLQGEAEVRGRAEMQTPHPVPWARPAPLPLSCPLPSGSLPPPPALLSSSGSFSLLSSVSFSFTCTDASIYPQSQSDLYSFFHSFFYLFITHRNTQPPL